VRLEAHPKVKSEFRVPKSEGKSEGQIGKPISEAAQRARLGNCQRKTAIPSGFIAAVQKHHSTAPDLARAFWAG
jgi:hypothetical protein